VSHYSSEQIEAYVLDPVPGALEDHLGTCDECRARLVREARLELQLADVARGKARAPVRRRGRTIAAVAACAVVIAGVFAVWALRTDDEPDRVVELVPIVRPIPPAIAPPRTVTPVKPPSAPPSASALRADEIEEMAAKSAAAFKACFARTRNPPRKVVVTIEVAPDGDVAKVYSTDQVLTTRYVFEHTPLGRCIHRTVQPWKFRKSSGGTYRFTLVSA
jgi:hypothetical protein